MNRIFDANSQVTGAISFATFIITMFNIGQNFYLPQLSLVIFGTLLIFQQMQSFKNHQVRLVELVLNFFTTLGFIAWMAYFYFGFFVWYAQGAEMPDNIHTVAMNNHGKIRYITSQQDLMIFFLRGWGLIAIIVSFFGKKKDK